MIRIRFGRRRRGEGPSAVFESRLALPALALVLALAWPSSSGAQELEPRAYSNTPVGMNFLIAGYAWQSGDVLTDPSAPIEDAKVTVHSALLAYARSFGLLGRSAKFDLILPWGWADGSASLGGNFYERKVQGLVDPRLRFSWNLAGAPAMDLEEYRAWRQDFIVGVSLSVFLPLGQYDSDKLLNLGTNRWTFRPEFGVSKALGNFVLEGAAGISLYTDNTDYFGGQTREQDPLITLQGHLLYNFPHSIWLAFDATFYAGGRATIDGVAAADQLENARVGGTLALPLGRHFSLKLYGSTGAYTSTGSDFDIVGAAIQYRWGGGL